VRLEGNAHLVQGFDSFSGGILNYDIKKDKMVAGKSNFDMSNPILNLKDKIIPIATLLMALFFYECLII
jgi:lipopolysaccharide export system protein LptA